MERYVFKQDDLVQQISDINKRLGKMEKSPQLISSSIGSGGLIIRDGGNFTLRDGGDITLFGNGTINLYPGDVIEGTAGTIQTTLDDIPAFYVTPPAISGATFDNYLYLEGRNVDTAGGFVLEVQEYIGLITLGSSSVLSLEAESTLLIVANGVLSINGDTIGINSTNQISLNSNTNQVNLSHTTTASAANCVISVSGLIQRSTSAQKYKQDIEDLDLNPEIVLNLRPRTWRDKNEVEENPDTDQRYVGFIAEEVDEIGLGQFVDRNEDGSLEYISYDRLNAALITLVKHQQEQIDNLMERVKALDNQDYIKPKRKYKDFTGFQKPRKEKKVKEIKYPVNKRRQRK